MKLIDNINNMGMYSKSKLIITSCLLIILLIISYFLINFFTNDYGATVDNPLSGKAYVALTDFKKNGIKFTDIDNIIKRIFDTTNDININIIPSGYAGRFNPFSI